MHDNEISLDDATARALVATQFPHLAPAPLRRVRSAGTVNTVFRVGEGHAARFPLVRSDPDEARRRLEAEARASAELALACPFPSPQPVGTGRPGEGYPLPWTLQTWVEGTDATVDDPGGSEAFASDLALLVRSLRARGTDGRRFTGAGRGGNLADHEDWARLCLHRSEGLLDVPRLAALWERFRRLPRRGPDVMSHGDLIPGNLLVADGRLTGVLDCGGFGPADPALDVSAAWHLLDDGPRGLFRAELGCDDLEWERSKAWAFVQALGAVWYYVRTNPTMARTGRRSLARVLAAPPL